MAYVPMKNTYLNIADILDLNKGAGGNLGQAAASGIIGGKEDVTTQQKSLDKTLADNTINLDKDNFDRDLGLAAQGDKQVQDQYKSAIEKEYKGPSQSNINTNRLDYAINVADLLGGESSAERKTAQKELVGGRNYSEGQANFDDLIQGSNEDARRTSVQNRQTAGIERSQVNNLNSAYNQKIGATKQGIDRFKQDYSTFANQKRNELMSSAADRQGEYYSGDPYRNNNRLAGNPNAESLDMWQTLNSPTASPLAKRQASNLINKQLQAKISSGAYLSPVELEYLGVLKPAQGQDRQQAIAQQLQQNDPIMKLLAPQYAGSQLTYDAQRGGWVLSGDPYNTLFQNPDDVANYQSWLQGNPHPQAQPGLYDNIKSDLNFWGSGLAQSYMDPNTGMVTNPDGTILGVRMGDIASPYSQTIETADNNPLNRQELLKYFNLPQLYEEYEQQDFLDPNQLNQYNMLDYILGSDGQNRLNQNANYFIDQNASYPDTRSNSRVDMMGLLKYLQQRS